VVNDLTRVWRVPARALIAMTMLSILAVSASSCQGGLTRRVGYRISGVAIQPLGFAARDGQSDFARTFCSTLSHLDSTGEWGQCHRWLEGAPVSAPAATADIPKTLGIMVVAGIFSECFKDAPIYKQGLEHLKDAHGLNVFEVPVSGIGSSEANTRQIETFLSQTSGDFIAIGYSKGISDLMVAIQLGGLASTRIKALVSVAGTVAGSRLADLPSERFLDGMERTLRRADLGDCDVSDAGGIRSLRREDRYSFLRRWKPPGELRTFSIVGVTTRKETSSVLHPLWDLVNYHSADQDSQVVAEEGILPAATFLGVAKGDHWALALPFYEAGKRLVSRNQYPRTALLEALVRTVHGL
jgi:hypothetical protein